MLEALTACLLEKGFTRIVTNLPEFVFFYRQEMQGVNVLQVIEYRSDLYISYDQYDHVKDTVCKLFYDKGVINVHVLSLILCHDTVKAKALYREDRFCWLIDTMTNRLIIYETQTPDFYGCRQILEAFLEQRSHQMDEAEGGITGYRSDTGAVTVSRAGKPDWSSLPFVTIIIVGLNIILYLLCAGGMDLLYNRGVLVGPAVVENGEYYRIFTSMFLHASVSHISSNMLVLYFMGEMIEKQLGHIRYLILYLGAGIGAAGASIWFQYLTQDYVGSVGASGAIYGVLGALLWLVIVHRGKFMTATLPRLLFFLLYSLYSGFTGTNIDNAAHVGGLLCGFVLGMVLYRRNKARNRRGEAA